MQTAIGNGEFTADWTRGTQTANGAGNFTEHGISPLPLATQPVVSQTAGLSGDFAGAQGYTGVQVAGYRGAGAGSSL